MAAPPLLAGASKETTACAAPATATIFRGALGIVGAGAGGTGNNEVTLSTYSDCSAAVVNCAPSAI